MKILRQHSNDKLFQFLTGIFFSITAGLVALLSIILMANWRESSLVHHTLPGIEETATNAVFLNKIPTSTTINTLFTIVTVTDTPTPTQTIEPTPSPQFGQISVIGYSVEGRPIEVYQFGNGPRQRLIVAGIHGGYEWNTVVLAEELITYLMENPDLIAPEVTLFILKNLNPDGYYKAQDATGRPNANGVDLNRNFDANWLIDWNRDVCFNQLYVTGGPEPHSEPETRAVIDFILSHEFEAMISYHSAGLGIFPGGIPPGPKSQMLAYYLSGISPYAYPPKDIGCVYSGAMANWAALHGIPSVDVELTTHGDTDFAINKRVLEYFIKADLELGE